MAKAPSYRGMRYRGNPECQINTPSQRILLAAACDLWSHNGSVIGTMITGILGADFAVMGGRMVFGEVVRQLRSARSPIHFELLLIDAILDPIKTHIHCF